MSMALLGALSDEPINLGLGGISFVVGVLAIYLSITHTREISRVQGALRDAQEQTKNNLTATTALGDQTLDALHLHEILVTNDHLSSSVKNLASDFAQVVKLDDPLLTSRAYEDVQQARNCVHMAAEGHITIGPEALAADEEIPSALLGVTEPGDQFWASSVVSPDFWVRASAYLQKQRERIGAGVVINRVFIFDTETSFNDTHAQQQLTQQVNAGINVHYVVGPKYAAQDLVAVARPNPGAGAERPDGATVLYAAEFRVADGRVNGIELWSAQAGHHNSVTRLWNILNRFYEDSQPYTLAKAEQGGQSTDHGPPEPAVQS